MNISEKLSSIDNSQIIDELYALVNTPIHVKISSLGRRLMCFEHFKGYVEIEDVAKRYLKASVFSGKNPPSIQERIKSYYLWEIIQEVYDKTSELLKKTCMLKVIASVREFNLACQAEKPTAIEIIQAEGQKKESLFEFSENEFKKMWPEVKASSDTPSKWHATKEMMFDAYLRLRIPEESKNV